MFEESRHGPGAYGCLGAYNPSWDLEQLQEKVDYHVTTVVGELAPCCVMYGGLFNLEQLFSNHVMKKTFKSNTSVYTCSQLFHSKNTPVIIIVFQSVHHAHILSFTNGRMNKCAYKHVLI